MNESSRDGLGPTPAELGRELKDLALAGAGWGALLRRIAEATGAAVRLVGVHGGVLAASDAGPASGLDPAEVSTLFARDRANPAVCTDGWEGRARPVTAGPRRVGVLLVESPVDAATARLQDAATDAIAIEAVRRDAMAEARAESASRLIDELRFGSLRDEDEVARASERFGLALDRPHAAAVFAYDGTNRRTWATALSWIEMPVRDDGPLGWTVLAGDVPAELTRVRTRLSGMVGDAPVLGACGPVVVGVHETARSFREAEAVLAMLRARPETVELTHAALGFAGLLLSVPPERLRAFVVEHLGPILGRTDLLDTLAAWFRTHGSRTAVAEQLNLHRNSVGYRMGKIRELLPLDPFDAEAAFQLQAALVAREVLAAVHDAGAAPVSGA